MFDYLREKIKKDRPFLSLVNISNIKKMSVYGNPERKLFSYGLSVQIRGSKGQCYKLRVSPSIKVAKEYERIIRSVRHIFPKFYGRDRNYLLFELLDGRTLDEDEKPDVFFKIGKMCAEISKYKAGPNKKRELESYYCKLIRTLLQKKTISQKDYHKILDSYEYLVQKIEYDVVLVITDIKKANFMLDSHGKLYFIDEDGVDYNIKGFWFDRLDFNKEQYKAFFKGYDSVDSLCFFNKKYERLVAFISSVSMLDFLLTLGEETTEGFKCELSHFLEIAKKEG
ncbi:MAG: hypothetical protein JRI96_14420 [Deltaproteobacteria bacterium]|nr:hypothetical protein [Deltaproteobacteria bacterium]